MKILVTGANGYIGSHVVGKMCDMGLDVIATDLANDRIDPRAQFLYADIFHGKNWFDFFHAPEICLHLAWRNGFVHDSDDHILDLSAHYAFLTDLIKGGVRHVACMGTMHEVGYWEGAVDENTPCRPTTKYAIAKNTLRQSLEIFCRENNCVYQWLRGYYTYSDETYGNSVFCKILQAVRDGKTVFPFTTGKNKYDFLHIGELVSQIVACILQTEVTGVINCCSGTPVSLAEQVERFIAEHRLSIALQYGKYPDRPYDSPCLYGDRTKIDRILRSCKTRNAMYGDRT